MPLSDPNNKSLFNALSRSWDWAQTQYRKLPSDVRKNLGDLIDAPIPGPVGFGKGTYQVADAILDNLPKAAPTIGMMMKLRKNPESAKFIDNLITRLVNHVKKVQTGELGGVPYVAHFSPSRTLFSSGGDKIDSLGFTTSEGLVRFLDPDYKRVVAGSTEFPLGIPGYPNYRGLNVPLEGSDLSANFISTRISHPAPTLAHETQHAIQQFDNPEIFRDYPPLKATRDSSYFNHPSEIEARQAEDIANENRKIIRAHIINKYMKGREYYKNALPPRNFRQMAERIIPEVENSLVAEFRKSNLGPEGSWLKRAPKKEILNSLPFMDFSDYRVTEVREHPEKVFDHIYSLPREYATKVSKILGYSPYPGKDGKWRFVGSHETSHDPLKKRILQYLVK